jgi:hypothetical protein
MAATATLKKWRQNRFVPLKKRHQKPFVPLKKRHQKPFVPFKKSDTKNIKIHKTSPIKILYCFYKSNVFVIFLKNFGAAFLKGAKCNDDLHCTYSWFFSERAHKGKLQVDVCDCVFSCQSGPSHV